MPLTLDELAREAAWRILVAALEKEVAAYLEQHQGELDEQGHRLVVRNGKAQAEPMRSPWSQLSPLRKAKPARHAEKGTWLQRTAWARPRARHAAGRAAPTQPAPARRPGDRVSALEARTPAAPPLPAAALPERSALQGTEAMP